MLHLLAVVLLFCVSAVAEAASTPYSEYEGRLDKFVIDTIGLAECSVYTELLRKANYYEIFLSSVPIHLGVISLLKLPTANNFPFMYSNLAKPHFYNINSIFPIQNNNGLCEIKIIWREVQY